MLVSVSDYLMGVYLLNVGAHDVIYRGQYNRHALYWMGSWGCNTGGVLAMLSSQASIFILTAMSLERYLVVAFPYYCNGLTMRTGAALLLVIWLVGILLALMPLTPIPGMGDFYGSNGVCFPLHIHDPYMAGWQYSAFMFLGINVLAMLVIFVSYGGMCYSIRSTQLSSGRHTDLSIAKRLFLIVLTDALCWIPIITIKILALAHIRITSKCALTNPYHLH